MKQEQMQVVNMQGDPDQQERQLPSLLKFNNNKSFQEHLKMQTTIPAGNDDCDGRSIVSLGSVSR